MENRRVTENNRLITALNQTNYTPKTLGSGTVTSVLGKGGFATVYEIWNPKLEVRRAVKLWHPNISQKSLERFETEIKITAKLHHPNIVDIHNVGEWNGLPYIEMEKIDGFSLKDLITQSNALPSNVALAISILVCRALTYAHQQTYVLYGIKRNGIIHCDIKPANIMISRSGNVKLADFGLATPTDETLHTEEDKVNGSLHYSSPEQLQAVQVDTRTDIYSLGVVIYEMFAGAKAFNGKTLEELVKHRLKDSYIPLHELCKDLIPSVKKIVNKCISFNREERYDSAQILLTELERVYYKLTKESPEKILLRYLTKSEEFTHGNRKPIRKFVLATLGTFLTALTILAYIFINKEIKKAEEPYPIGEIPSINTLKQSAPDQNIKEVPITRHPQKISVVPKNKNQTANLKAVRNDVKSTNIKKSNTSKIDPVPKAPSLESILEQITSLISKNDFSKAEQLFKTYQYKDGEYFLLYAQLLAHKGKWQEGLSYAENGFQTSSLRLNSSQLRGLYLETKARCLSTAFNKSNDKIDAQKAMEAWFDVKYFLKSNQSSALYNYADSEIRHINAILQKDPSTN
jgi:serine/threonine protein kinase